MARTLAYGATGRPARMRLLRRCWVLTQRVSLSYIGGLIQAVLLRTSLEAPVGTANRGLVVYAVHVFEEFGSAPAGGLSFGGRVGNRVSDVGSRVPLGALVL